MLLAENVKGILVRQWSRKKSCDEVDTVREFAYLGDRVSACGGCDSAVTARTRCGYVKLRECGELLYCRFPLKLKGVVYKSYARPAKVHGSEACCLKRSEVESYEGQRDRW